MGIVDFIVLALVAFCLALAGGFMGDRKNSGDGRRYKPCHDGRRREKQDKPQSAGHAEACGGAAKK